MSSVAIAQQSSSLASPTTEQILVEKLRRQIEDLIPVDDKLSHGFYLLFWLKARKMNVDATEQAIRNSFKWRKELNVDQLLLEKVPLEYREHFKFQRGGRDKDGAPVMLSSMGSWDVRGFLDKYGKESFLRCMRQSIMMDEKELMDYNKSIEKGNSNYSKTKGCTLVISALGYSMRQARSLQTIRSAMEVARVDSTYFPFKIEKLYIINVSSTFMTIFKMVSPILNIPISGMYDTDQSKWKPVLLESIEEDQLTPEFGGTKVPSDLD